MNEQRYSKEIANAVDNFLTEDGWRYDFDEEQGVFRFNLSINSRIKKIAYIIEIRRSEYTVLAVSPIGADSDDKESMAAMAEFVCRANYGLRNGCFELDMRDGEIRYRCYVDCYGIMPTKDIVHGSIQCPAVMFERYGAGITDVIFGMSEPQDAVEQCERIAAEQVRAMLMHDTYEADEQPEGDDDTEESQPELKTDLFGTEGGED